MDSDYKFVCESCNYKTNIKTRMEKHFNSELHKTGKKKIRSNYKGEYKCEKCDYSNINKYNYKEHYLNHHGTLEEREKEFKYYCKDCDYGTYSKKFIDNHNISTKHKYKILLKVIPIENLKI